MSVAEAPVRESPDEVPPAARAPRKRRGIVRVFGKWCKGCGLCIAFCPQQVLAEDDEHHPIVAHPERCIGCEWCEIHCPDFAIEVEPYENAGDD